MKSNTATRIWLKYSSRDIPRILIRYVKWKKKKKYSERVRALPFADDGRKNGEFRARAIIVWRDARVGAHRADIFTARAYGETRLKIPVHGELPVADVPRSHRGRSAFPLRRRAQIDPFRGRITRTCPSAVNTQARTIWQNPLVGG